MIPRGKRQMNAAAIAAISGQVHMFPAERLEMEERMVGHILSPAKGTGGPFAFALSHAPR